MKRRIFLLAAPMLFLAWFFIWSGTAKAEETILYQENFSNGQANGWQEQADLNATWKVENEKYHLSIAGYDAGAESIYQNGFSWQNYIFSFDVNLTDGVDRNVIFRRQDKQNYYSLGLRGFWCHAPDDTPVIYLQRCYQGQCVGHNYRNYFAAYHFTDQGALNHGTSHFDIEAMGDRIRIFYNNNLVIDWQETADNYPKSGTIGFVGWSGHYGAADVAWDNLVVRTAWPQEPVQKTEPVIIVPGIMGSDLINASEPGDKIWLDINRVIGSLSDDFLSYLEMDNNGDTINAINIGDVIREIKALGIYNQDVLKGLISYLQTNGYQENENLFVFPYDWRQGIDLTAAQLNQKILDVLSRTGSQQVNIIAHSMGGLVVKNYMKEYANQNKINKFIDIATPHLGAPKAFKALKYGDDFGFRIGGLVFLNSEEIKIISQNMPSVYELLPSAAYYDSGHIDYNFVYSDQGFKYDYNDMNSYLRIWNNPILVNKAKEFHNNIDDYSSYAGSTQIYNIIGCGFATLGKIIKLNQEKDHDEYRVDYISGDGTVPLKSAEGIPANKKYYYDGAEHMSLPSANGITQLIGSILDNKESQFDLSPYPISIQSDICQIRGKLVTYHSPIALHVYDDENGRHVGPDANGDIENQIPGAQYDIIEDNKFVFLPSGHTYRIVGQATGLGTFNSRVETIDNGVITETAYYNQIPITTFKTNVEMTVMDNQTDYTMKVDQDGDQIFEATAQPSSILDEQGSADLAKPETSINISEPQGNDNWHTSPVQISFTASDEGGSGILKTEYSLDNGQTWQAYTDAINIDKQGANKILYKSIDKAGNIEEEQTTEFKIDSIMPNSNSIVIGTMGQNDWYTSDVQVLLSAEDGADGSGLDKIEYSADNGSTWLIYSQAIVIHNDGKSNILYRALDKAGNQTANQETAVQIDQTPPTLEMITPLDNDEYDHAETLEILYNSIDSASWPNNIATKTQIDDGQATSTTSIDLFPYHLGGHQLIVKIFDLAGNQTATTVPFSIITSIPGTIDDIKRLYSEKQITKASVKDELIKELNSLQQYFERFGKRQDKRLSKYQERLEKCDKRKKRVVDCRESVKKRYERQVYVLNKAHAKIVANRFADLLKDLEKYYSKKWLTPRAYEMIKQELIYLKNNL